MLCRSKKKASMAEAERGKGKLVLRDDGQVVQGLVEHYYFSL